MADATGLAHTDALLRAIAEGTTDVVFVRDLEGRYVLANSAAARANGVSVEDLVGSDDSLIFPPDVVREMQEDDRRTIEAGVTRTFVRTLQPQGETRTYHVTKGPCRDQDGSIIGVFVISRDITERKHIEDERDRLLEREHALREEADRARAAAEAAAKEAHQANQARDAVLGVVAHDLRNPLNAIALQARLITVRMDHAGTTSEPARAAVESILAEVKLMDRLVQDLLDVTRIEAGELPLNLELLGIEPLVAEAVDLARPLASSKSQQLELRVLGQPGEVRGDRHRLLQVLGNLIGNAVKFTGEGGKISVTADKVGPDIRIAVADTGPGIPAEQLPHVFDRFWRATANDRKHTGLGLSIAQGVVRAHGGRIWAESTPASGSTFFVLVRSAP